MKLFDEDSNGRSIDISRFENVRLIGNYYPDVKFYCGDKIFSPIRETIMSMPDMIFNTSCSKETKRIENCPVFFFIYNVDNYYHFVYDTLPYLISYQSLKKTIPQLKILINVANSQQNKLNKFVVEFLELFNIQESDLIYSNEETLYNTVYVSNSYTHDDKSNLPPRKEIYDLYKSLSDNVKKLDGFVGEELLPRKLYISRRSHKHGNYDNIGTNYTTRRNLKNEDQLVILLESYGYLEVFTELMSTKEKIILFRNCTDVIGPIGGGLCNVLFSKPNTKLTAIVSPGFLDINGRFSYSFANVSTKYFNATQHIEVGKYKKYMRVFLKNLNVVGEIKDIQDNKLNVIYSLDALAGWNAQTAYYNVWVEQNEVDIIDNGLNSEWFMDLDKFQKEVLDVE